MNKNKNLIWAQYEQIKSHNNINPHNCIKFIIAIDINITWN